MRKKFQPKKPRPDSAKRSSRAAIKAIAREYELKKAELQGKAPVMKKGLGFYMVVIIGMAMLASMVLSVAGKGGKAAVTPIYYMDNLAGLNFNPTEYVDITDEIDLKIDMLECHESQLKWMRDHDHIDFAEFVRSCSRFRGLQCGVQYAEAFSQEMVWPKVTTRRLLP
jgi:LmbE family N-acetylglucosaminyl deacetylase